jgi:hypothetical protein
MRKLIAAAFLLMTGCTDPVISPEGERQNFFFDLKGYFEREAGRLSAEGKPVVKEVIRNGSTERKTVRIDWYSELALFRESDINKAAWRDSYRTEEKSGTITYTATDEDLRTRKITLEKGPDGKLKHVRIRNRTSNFLYTTSEVLDYYPGSGYRMEKNQQVRIIGTSHYTIKTQLK